MPWRDDANIYHIWLSEIMLQQTSVSTVIPFFKEFCKKWPTVTKLSESDLSEVLSFWSGLGYGQQGRLSMSPGLPFGARWKELMMSCM